MSSDMSLWVEVRGDDGVFRVVLPDGTPADPSEEPRHVDWLYERNYIEYSLLGLGSRRHGITPIVPTRGVPEDASEQPKRWILDYPMVAASWFTAAELLAVDWNARLRYRTYFHPVDDVTSGKGTDECPYLDLDGTTLREPYLVVVDEGPEWTSRVEYPVAIDVPLSVAATGLYALMEATVALSPATPETVRAIYAFDQY